MMAGCMPIDVVFFELGGRRCALSAETVREVLPLPAVTPVPLAPTAVRGIAPVHGRVLPVIDPAAYFAPGTEARGDAARTRAGRDQALLLEVPMATAPAAVRAVLVVGRITRLGAVDERHARPPPPGMPFVSATVLGLEGPTLLLDAERLLEGVRDAIRSGGAAA